MAPPDMDVIKEVPGYKVILKAVLKAQIQQLIEQLATTTEEESIIITASVADGTLSHLGSDSAKGFLEDHEDVKSQFLGYCLKTHHQRKQEEKERKDLEAEVAKIQQALPPLYPSPRGSLRGGYRARAPRFTSPRFPGVRHEPYSVPRTPSVRPGVSPMATEPKTNVKTEPYDPNMNTSGVSLLDNDDDNSKSSSSTIPTEQGQEGMGQGSGDVSGLVVAGSADDDNDTDNVTIKQEILQGEEDLEITGVEPGMPIPTSQAWDPNAAMGMNFDPSGATGSQADLAAQQGYTYVENMTMTMYPDELQAAQQHMLKNHIHQCLVCGKIQPSPGKLERHMRIHTGEKPFKCDWCDYHSSRKDSMRKHHTRCVKKKEIEGQI
ncbi:zinc finger and BTB domain-containing protein 7B-like isoform X10 [Mya arenaria]|uniref:zinc finger and BTB domain-containing protein 7B-like isoform X10 n=1 Tax=Mya arenaria TaxID=6604 RepID=UPI0022E71E16|nr:zinc finger and BTB domain-containing protein 7B-like isoform X10 [Mya arenaria]